MSDVPIGPEARDGRLFILSDDGTWRMPRELPPVVGDHSLLCVPESRAVAAEAERDALHGALERIGYREESSDGEVSEMRWIARMALGWVCSFCGGRRHLMEPDGSKYQACPVCDGTGHSVLAASVSKEEARDGV